jgi:hypothetical protein
MKTKITWFDRVMAAATFAEANEHETAKEFLISTGTTPGNKLHCEDRDACRGPEPHNAKVNS